jgi:biotin carboxylase
MVKAPDASGSRGVHRVDGEAGFEPAWASALATSRSGRVIVEKHLAGVEFGAQAVVHGDRLVGVYVHNDTVTDGVQPTPVGHSMPSALSAEHQGAVAAVLEGAVAALGIRDCVANADLMLAGDEVMLIEMGARMGATGIPEVIAVHEGVDIYAHVLGLALGDHGSLAAAAARPNAVRLLASPRSGRVVAVDVPSTVAGHDDLIAVHWDVAPGDEVRAFRVGPDRIGHVQAVGRSAEAADALVTRMAAELVGALVLGADS